jgi:hypothetical protein
MREVDFVYFNLSTNEIRVTDVAGLPRDMTPGVLVPVADDTNRLNESSATCWESVSVGDAIKITWTESGTSRQFEAKRAELSIPARLDGGQVRFTYRGRGQWRIRFVDQNI